MAYTKFHEPWGSGPCCGDGPDPGQPDTVITKGALDHWETGIFDAAADADAALAALAGKLDTTAIVQTIINGDTTHAPSSDVVFDTLAGKLDTTAIVQTVTNGDTTHSPSGDAVFDAITSATVTAAGLYLGLPRAVALTATKWYTPYEFTSVTTTVESGMYANDFTAGRTCTISSIAVQVQTTRWRGGINRPTRYL